MLNITYLNPAIIQLSETSFELEKELSFRDKGIEYQIHRLRKGSRNFSPEWTRKRMAELQSQVTRKLIWTDDKGRILTYSGFVPRLVQDFGARVSNFPKPPEENPLPWKTKPSRKLWEHQLDIIEKLTANSHAAVSAATGSGKSIALIQIVRNLGKKTLIIAPLTGIAEQLHEELTALLGSKYVGFFGGSKKESKKKIVVGTFQSLTRVDENSDHYGPLSQTELLIVDESHQTPSATLEAVCMGVAKNAPYRYFFSATQIRTDGADKLLEGIIGPVVYTVTLPELVERGILAKPLFKMIEVPLSSAGASADPKEETRQQLYLNPFVFKNAADIANKAVTQANRPTLILVEEFAQYEAIKPLLKVPHLFASSKTDAMEAVGKFNAGEVKLLVGTSAVATGVDTRPVQCLIYLQGLSSEIKVMQAVGRGTRLCPGKKDFWVIDFMPVGSRTCEKHAKAREEIYNALYPQFPTKRVKLESVT